MENLLLGLETIDFDEDILDEDLFEGEEGVEIIVGEHEIDFDIDSQVENPSLPSVRCFHKVKRDIEVVGEKKCK